MNLDLTSPALTFLNGGVGLNLLTTAFPVPSFQIPFSLPMPLSAGAQMVVVDPALSEGLALSHACDYTSAFCGLQQNFDALTPNSGGTSAFGPYPVGWGSGGGTAQWQVRTGTTGSGSTGPLVGAFSPGNYMYCESSSPNSGGGTFHMDTCLYDPTTLGNFVLNFRLSRIGATIGTLSVLMDDGSGAFATTLATYTGPEPTGTDWTLESLPFVPPGSQVAFRFAYSSGASFTGDIAIDDFDLN